MDDLLDPVLRLSCVTSRSMTPAATSDLMSTSRRFPVHQGAVAARIRCYYRGAGQSALAKSPWCPVAVSQATCWGRSWPKSVVGKSLQYYIQAFDGKGRVTAAAAKVRLRIR